MYGRKNQIYQKHASSRNGGNNMVVAYYIEIEHPKTVRDLAMTLLNAGFTVLDATKYDSYTSGPCALKTLDEIEKDLNKPWPSTSHD